MFEHPSLTNSIAELWIACVNVENGWQGTIFRTLDHIVSRTSGTYFAVEATVSAAAPAMTTPSYWYAYERLAVTYAETQSGESAIIKTAGSAITSIGAGQTTIPSVSQPSDPASSTTSDTSSSSRATSTATSAATASSTSNDTAASNGLNNAQTIATIVSTVLAFLAIIITFLAWRFPRARRRILDQQQHSNVTHSPLVSMQSPAGTGPRPAVAQQRPPDAGQGPPVGGASRPESAQQPAALAPRPAPVP